MELSKNNSDLNSGDLFKEDEGSEEELTTLSLLWQGDLNVSGTIELFIGNQKYSIQIGSKRHLKFRLEDSSRKFSILDIDNIEVLETLKITTNLIPSSIESSEKIIVSDELTPEFLSSFEPGKDYELVFSYKPETGLSARFLEYNPARLRLLWQGDAPIKGEIALNLAGEQYLISLQQEKGITPLIFSEFDSQNKFSVLEIDNSELKVLKQLSMSMKLESEKGELDSLEGPLKCVFPTVFKPSTEYELIFTYTGLGLTAKLVECMPTTISFLWRGTAAVKGAINLFLAGKTYLINLDNLSRGSHLLEFEDSGEKGFRLLDITNSELNLAQLSLSAELQMDGEGSEIAPQNIEFNLSGANFLPSLIKPGQEHLLVFSYDDERGFNAELTEYDPNIKKLHLILLDLFKAPFLYQLSKINGSYSKQLTFSRESLSEDREALENYLEDNFLVFLMDFNKDELIELATFLDENDDQQAFFTYLVLIDGKEKLLKLTETIFNESYPHINSSQIKIMASQFIERVSLNFSISECKI